MKFGENLQKLRKEKGISQEQLAEQLGVTRQSVSKWESGASYPEMDKIVMLCQYFHCDINVLINKDVSEERQKREASNAFKKFFEGVFLYLRKIVYLFEHLSIKEFLKMAVQVFIIVCVILLLAIPFVMLRDVIVSLFYTGDNIFSHFFHKFWYFIFNLGYIVFAITSFIYIFKIKYLDSVQFVQSNDEVIVNDEEAIDEKEVVNVIEKPVKVSINKSKISEFSIVDFFVKVIVLFFKGFLIIMLFPLLLGFVMTIIGFVLLISIIFRGVFLSGPILLGISIIIFLLILIKVCINFILNLKTKKQLVIITLLSSIALGAIGVGLSIWYFVNLTIINEVPKEFKASSIEEVYPMDNDLVIYSDWYGNLDFVVDNSMNDTVKVRVDYYPEVADVSIVKNDDDIYLSYDSVRKLDIGKITKIIINDLKDKKVHSYQLDASNMTITTSSKNIEILKKNIN